jgi:Arc/MetJ-type ribon-helix-helix transcriptional regulator
MNDVLVSIRMPAPLDKRLGTLCEKNFYMDLSEQIRAVLNKKFLEYRDQKADAMKKRSNKHEKEKVLEDMLERNEQLLRELKESLRNIK